MGLAQINDHSSSVDLDKTIHVHVRTFIAIAAICLIYFAGLVGIVGSGVLAQSIGQLFDGTSKSTWLSQSITIATTILNLPLCQAADLWGRKWILVVTTLVGCVGCIIISRANNMSTVIGGFIVLGTSYGSQSLLLAVVSEVVPRKQRPFAQAAANIAASLGAIIGLVMGGALLRNRKLENFRIYFYVDAGIFAVVAIGCALCYNPPLRKLQMSLTQGEKFRRLDWIGWGLFSPALTLFCMALAWSQNPYSWRDAHVMATFITGVVLLIAFFIYEWRFKTDGLLHHGLFSRNFSIALGIIFVEGLSFFTANSYFVYEVGVLQQTDLLISSMHFSILFISTAVFASLFGLHSSKKKSIRAPLCLGFVCLLTFNILMATSDTSTSKNVFWGYPVIAGVGLGAILPISMVAAQLSTPPELITLATGLMISVRTLGASVGLAINTAIFSGAFSSNVPSKIAAAALPLGLPASSLASFIGALASSNFQALQSIPGVTPRIIDAGVAALTEAYSICFRNVWIAAGCFSFIAVVAAAFLKDPQLEFSNHIDAPVEKQLLNLQESDERNVDVVVWDKTKMAGE